MATRPIDIMILGALKEQPMSAYEMDKLMDARELRKWIRVSSPSVYRNLIKLSEAGYATGKTVKEGEMPEKTVYSITPQGEERFKRLMGEVVEAPARVDFDFAAVIANLWLMDETDGRTLLKSLKDEYRARAVRIDGHLDEPVRLEAATIMDLCAQTYRLIADRIEEFEAEYYREGISSWRRGWIEGRIPEEILRQNGGKG
jgi:DNA-binding PadR family transcriptional regulator